MTIANVPTVTTKKMKDIYLSSIDGVRDDYFYIVVSNQLYARIYLKKDRWYIWYEQKGFRKEVPSFTYALAAIEQEVSS